MKHIHMWPGRMILTDPKDTVQPIIKNSKGIRAYINTKIDTENKVSRQLRDTFFYMAREK
jgi:hypothetical protein